MIMQLCKWHDSEPGDKKPTGKGAELPLTDKFWAPNKLTESGLMTCMCRRCKNIRLKWERNADKRAAKELAREARHAEYYIPRFTATCGNVISIFKAVV